MRRFLNKLPSFELSCCTAVLLVNACSGEKSSEMGSPSGAPVLTSPVVTHPSVAVSAAASTGGGASGSATGLGSSSVAPPSVPSAKPALSASAPLAASASSAPPATSSPVAAASSQAPAGTLALSDLKIEANPNSVLSVYVSWKTPTAASSTVQFGVGAYTWEISDTAMNTDHKVLVIGMRAASKYQMKAVSVGAGGSGEVVGEFTTKALPPEIPVGEITAVDAKLAQPGWTLMNVQVGDGSYRARSAKPPMAVMYDEEGQPVWYFIDGKNPDIGGAVSTQLTDKGVLMGPMMQGAGSPREADFAGNVIWECKDARCGGTSDLSHHGGKLPNGNYVVNRDVTSGSVTMPVFEELAPPDNKVAWKIDLRSLVTPPQSASGDWCHGNSITVKADKDEVYVSCRFLGVFKTTYNNPKLVWHLPASYGAKGMGNFKFDPPESQFSDIHDPEIHEDGTVIVFDNGGWAGTVGEYNPTNLKSRVVEYQLDVANGVAKRVWEFPGTFNVDPWYKTKWYEPFWGDANRLENGNVLMTAGMRGPDLRSRVFEATKADGKVVWEIQLPPDFGLYRATRIKPPLVHRIN